MALFESCTAHHKQKILRRKSEDFCGGALSTAVEPKTSSTIIAKVEGKRESKNRPVATNFQFLKIFCPLGQLLVGACGAPNPAVEVATNQELSNRTCDFF